jgi:hypothetical protein
MNEKRSLLMLSAAVLIGGFAACNYTDGECWYYGEGSENAGTGPGAGPGGGVIVPTGPSGSYGDTPPKEPQDGPDQPQDTEPKPKCNSDEESDEESDAEPEFGKPANAYIDCKKRGLSAGACSLTCGEAGAYCNAVHPHPKKSGQGTGQLVWCKNGSPTYVCNYDFPNGDSCAGTYTPLGTFWICAYPGGKQ